MTVENYIYTPSDKAEIFSKALNILDGYIKGKVTFDVFNGSMLDCIANSRTVVIYIKSNVNVKYGLALSSDLYNKFLPDESDWEAELLAYEFANYLLGMYKHEILKSYIA